MGNLRKYLIAGLLVWLPLAATIVIVKFVIDILDKTILLIPPEFRPEAVFGFAIPGFGILVSIAVLIVTGMLAANLFGRRLVGLWEAILGRIPLVRTIYSSVKQVTETLLATKSTAFRKVVLVEFPRKGAWSVGFLTNREVIAAAASTSGRDLVSVFVPTTPNPTTGFIMMLPAEEVTELPISVEDGFKYIISMGVVVNNAAKDRLTGGQLAPTQGGP